MYVSLQHPDITAIEATGYPTRMQRQAHVCPVCEQECDWVFRDRIGNPVGCDTCLRRETVEEYYGEI